MKIEEAIAILERKTTIPGDGYTWEQIEEAIDAALTALRSMPETTKPGWISVKERFPDEELKKFRDLNGLKNGIGHINVLGSIGKHTLKNTVEYDGKNFWYEGRWMNSELTHWMPLPEPPEEG